MRNFKGLGRVVGEEQRELQNHPLSGKEVVNAILDVAQAFYGLIGVREITRILGKAESPNAVSRTVREEPLFLRRS